VSVHCLAELRAGPAFAAWAARVLLLGEPGAWAGAGGSARALGAPTSDECARLAAWLTGLAGGAGGAFAGVPALHRVHAL